VSPRPPFAEARHHEVLHSKALDGYEAVIVIVTPTDSEIAAVVEVADRVPDGPREQPSIDLRRRLAGALIVAVDDHSATMQMHLRRRP
jgi:hypothetical protein